MPKCEQRWVKDDPMQVDDHEEKEDRKHSMERGQVLVDWQQFLTEYDNAIQQYQSDSQESRQKATFKAFLSLFCNVGNTLSASYNAITTLYSMFLQVRANFCFHTNSYFIVVSTAVWELFSCYFFASFERADENQANQRKKICVS